MSEKITHGSERNGPPYGDASIIPSAAEIAAREDSDRQRRQDNDHKLILELQQRQTDAQEIQARTNRVIAALTAALVLVAVVSGFIAYFQFTAANNSARAAQSAAETAANTRIDFKASSSDTKTQVDRLIDQQERTANSMERSLQQSQEAAAATDRQSRAALDFSIGNARNDQRAWVGIVSVLPAPGRQNGVFTYLTPGVKDVLGVSVKNFGRSASLNTAFTISLRPFSRGAPFQPIYTPRTADFDRLSRTVLMPGVETALAIGTPDAWTEAQIAEFTSRRLVYYMFGHIDYDDAFGKPHVTTFCFLLAASLLAFNSCETYNTAD